MEEIFILNKARKKVQRFLLSKHEKDLAHSLNVSKEYLNQQIAFPLYEQFGVPKKSGGYREIQAPHKELKAIQKQLANILNNCYGVPNGVHGFIKSKAGNTYDILSNANNHLGKKWVWNIDIALFFSSITTTMVVNRLMQAPFNFNETKAKYVALIAVYQKKLPTGSPCSPVLSNLVCTLLDQQINEWVLVQTETAALTQVVYTRYADDLTFSANQQFSLDQKEEIFAMLNRYGFDINDKKVREQSHKQAQWVTGIKVNEKPNLCRKNLRNIRAILHQCRTKGLTQTATQFFELKVEANPEEVRRFLLILRGRIAHIGFVKGRGDLAYLKYLNEWRLVC
ncbi:MAG: reverse transcriptase domain-containing protein [bacterium]|nr:reverse transcriptase domain-containing protein [bacterium]